MRKILALVFALLLAWHAPVLAQTFRPIDDPEKFAADVVQTIANGASNDAARTIIEAVGQPAALSAIQSALQIFGEKNSTLAKR